MRVVLTSAIVATLALGSSLGLARASSLSVVYGFCKKKDCADGRNSSNAVSWDSAGNLYGVTEFQSLKHGTGVLFELAANGDGTYSEHVLYKFCDRNNKKCDKGSVPNGQVAVDPDGNVFGTTFRGDGGKADGSILYERTAAGNYKVVYKFCPTCNTTARAIDGVTWKGAQTGAPWDGKTAYIVTTNDIAGPTAGGHIYQLTKSKRGKIKVSLIHEILDARPGALTVDPSGNLFYTIRDPDHGQLNKLAFDGTNWVNTTLWTFCAAHTDCKEGKDPRSLVADKTGNLFGTTAAGSGSSKNGTVYRLTAPSFTNMSVLHGFCVDKDCTDGVNTSYTTPMAVDLTGNIYGVTADGGGNQFQGDDTGAGVLFRIGSDGSYTNVYSFCQAADCTDGADPLGGVTIDESGKVYGTTFEGGPSIGSGEVFRFTP